MKKLYLLIICAVFIKIADAQVCAIDYTQTGAGIYPDTLPPATAGVFYDDDITFVLPTDTAGFDFTNFQIISANTPLGMSWECNNNQNGCNYDPQVDPYGCARVYGTPIIPGFYEVEIVVMADLTISSGNLISFFVYLEVLPSQQSNAGFSLNPAWGCDEITVEFINNNPSGGYVPVPNLTQGFLYTWDFDNGTQSILENPPPQTYSALGEYIVDYNCIIDTLGFFLSGVTVNTVGCSDAIGYGNPDLYLLLYDADWNVVLTTQAALNDNNLPQSWSMNIELDNPPYFLQVWDDDSDNLWGTADDNCIDGSENPPPGPNADGISILIPAINIYGPTTQAGNNGGLNLTYTINKPIIEISAQDTINVYQGIDVPVVTYNPGTNTLSTPDLGYVYQWYVDGSPISGATGTEYQPTGAGSYSVLAVDDPCFAESASFEFTANLFNYFKQSIKLYPNPAQDVVTIEFGDKQVNKIEAFDVTGRLVYSAAGNFSQEEKIDVTSFGKGYFTVVLTGDDSTWSNKLLVK